MHRWRSPGANLGPGWLMVLVAPADSWLWSSAGPVCLFHLVEVDEHRAIQGGPRLEILGHAAHGICVGLTEISRECIEHCGEHLEVPGARDGSRGAVANALCAARQHEKPVRDPLDHDRADPLVDLLAALVGGHAVRPTGRSDHAKNPGQIGMVESSVPVGKLPVPARAASGAKEIETPLQSLQ